MVQLPQTFLGVPAFDLAPRNRIPNGNLSWSEVTHESQYTETTSEMASKIKDESIALIHRSHSRIDFPRYIETQEPRKDTYLEIRNRIVEGSKTDRLRFGIWLLNISWNGYVQIQCDFIRVP